MSSSSGTGPFDESPPSQRPAGLPASAPPPASAITTADSAGGKTSDSSSHSVIVPSRNLRRFVAGHVLSLLTILVIGLLSLILNHVYAGGDGCPPLPKVCLELLGNLSMVTDFVNELTGGGGAK